MPRDRPEAQAALTTALTRVDDVLARLPPELSGGLPSWDLVPHAELEAVVGSVLHAVREFAANALAERDAAEAQERERVTARDAAARQLVCRQKGQQARAVLVDLAARQDQLDALAERVAVARRASCVAGDVRALADAAARTSAARQRASAAARRVGELGPGVDVSDGAATQRLARTLSGFDACLAEEAALDEALAKAQRRRTAQEQEAADAQQAQASLEADVARLVVASAEVAEQQQVAGVAAAALPQAQLDVDEAMRLLRFRTGLDLLTSQLSDARERARVADDAARIAQAGWLNLRQEHLDGLAARLATGLVDGAPCPVCGSSRHPSPADLAAAVPDEVVAAAETEWADRRADFAEAQRDVAAREGQVLALREQVGASDRDAVLLSADLAAARNRLSAVEAHTHALAALGERANRLAGELTSVHAQHDRARRAMQQTFGRLDAMRAEAERTERDLSERRRRHTEGCPCATTSRDEPGAAARHTEVANALADLLDATRCGAEAAQYESAIALAVADRLADNGFGSVAAARAAIVPEDALTGQERRLAQAERERVQAQTVLDDPEVARALSDGEANLVALDAELAQVRRTRHLADRTSALAEQGDRDLTHLRVLVGLHAQRLPASPSGTPPWRGWPTRRAGWGRTTPCGCGCPPTCWPPG